jgi:excisionase family DNA binding protein
MTYHHRTEPAGELCRTLPQAASLTGLSSRTLRRLADQGSIRLFRVGKRTLVDGASVVAFLNRCPTAGRRTWGRAAAAA